MAFEYKSMTDTDSEERKSKSQIKREMQVLRDLGKQLIVLPETSLQKIPMTDQLREAVLAAKGFKREALRRQIQHIGGLMREVDVDAISRALEGLARPHREEVQAFHEIEQWRDALIEGDNSLLEELANRFEAADRQYLRQLARNARKEREQNRPPKSARTLFRYLSDLRSEE